MKRLTVEMVRAGRPVPWHHRSSLWRNDGLSIQARDGGCRRPGPLAGNYTPNQAADPGLRLGDSVTGKLVGASGYEFTTSEFVSQAPAPAYSGINPPTSMWYDLFFPNERFGGGEVNSGPFGWGWHCTYGPDLCYNTETWADADFDNAGQSDSPQ